MKKKILVAAMLLISVLCVAKKRVITIKTIRTNKGNTEVVNHGNEGNGSDTLSVLPGSMATYIEFSAKDSQGITQFLQQVPANIKMVYVLDLPDLPDGCLFIIRDNNGVVYTDYEIQ